MFSLHHPNFAVGMRLLFCNETLVRFLNLPDVFGLRPSPLLLKIQSHPFSKTALKLNPKLAFSPTSPYPLSHPTRASLGCGYSGWN